MWWDNTPKEYWIVDPIYTLACPVAVMILIVLFILVVKWLTEDLERDIMSHGLDQAKVIAQSGSPFRFEGVDGNQRTVS